MNSTDYLVPILKMFQDFSDPVYAERQSAYMRNKFIHFGLGSSQRRELQKEFIKKYGYPERNKVHEVVKILWEYPERECQYFAIEILVHFNNDYRKDDIDLFEKLIIEKSWWDSVDGIAASVCGYYFRLFPENILPRTRKWMDSGNIWLQRTAILFQLKYKNNTDFDLLTTYILELRQSREFFIQKAIGWMLREYARHNPGAVIQFVKTNQLAPLSSREALRALKKKGLI